MPLRSRSFPLAVLFTLSATLLTGVNPASGQTSNTSGGLQMLQGLSPQQREALSRQLGGLGAGGLGGAQGTLGGRGKQADEELLNITAQQQRELLMDAEKQRAELQRLSPFLEGEDWLVITIDSNPLPAEPQTPTTPQTSALGSLANLPPNALSALRSGLGAAAAISAGVTAGGYVEPAGTADQEKRAMISLIRAKNPYQLSRDGVLALPGFAPVPLAGLTEQLATLRLGVEPALRDLYVRVTKLPLNKVGPTALKPFGYDLFDREISTFAPATNVPVPSDYIVGPGDQLEVQLYGKENDDFQLVVGRDGRVSFPELGPMSVAGQTFESVKTQLEARVRRQMIGVRASVTMADTRTIRVFVLGDAKQPGSYTVSGLGTISSALYAAGGVKPIGSLRNIQLKRRTD